MEALGVAEDWDEFGEEENGHGVYENAAYESREQPAPLEPAGNPQEDEP